MGAIVPAVAIPPLENFAMYNVSREKDNYDR